jgi:hypothetical protein
MAWLTRLQTDRPKRPNLPDDRVELAGRQGVGLAGRYRVEQAPYKSAISPHKGPIGGAQVLGLALRCCVLYDALPLGDQLRDQGGRRRRYYRVLAIGILSRI